MSNILVEGLDFKTAPGREERLVGEAKETLFIDNSNEGVKGVLVSERPRAREGVLGWLYMVRTSQERRTNNAQQRVFNRGHVIVSLSASLI
jgi:hypothetical protein